MVRFFLFQAPSSFRGRLEQCSKNRNFQSSNVTVDPRHDMYHGGTVNPVSSWLMATVTLLSSKVHWLKLPQAAISILELEWKLIEHAER